MLKNPHAVGRSVTAPLFGKVLVATDGSPCAEQAVDVAIDLAKRYESHLSIVSVIPRVPTGASTPEEWVPKVGPDRERPHYRTVLEAAIQRAESSGLSNVTGALLEGEVVEEVLRLAEGEQIDLLVLGSRGLSTAKRILLGSVSDGLIHHLKIPVFLVHLPSA